MFVPFFWIRRLLFITELQIEPVINLREQLEKLRTDLEKARLALVEAEAELAQEQAAVNAFRMHCRLKLDAWVGELLEVQTEKQSCLTQLQLLRQGISFDEEDPFWQVEEPPPDGEESEDVLILPTDVPRDKAAEKRLYRELARQFHPDLAETAVERAYRTSMMTAVNNAYEAHDIQSLYDLAGELDPSEIAELAGIETVEIRRLREQILNCQRRRRKVRQRFKTSRRENTARLWRKARQLEADGDNWWAVVRRELEQTIARQKQQVADLKAMIEEQVMETAVTPSQHNPHLFCSQCQSTIY